MMMLILLLMTMRYLPRMIMMATVLMAVTYLQRMSMFICHSGA